MHTGVANALAAPVSPRSILQEKGSIHLGHCFIDTYWWYPCEKGKTTIPNRIPSALVCEHVPFVKDFLIKLTCQIMQLCNYAIMIAYCNYAIMLLFSYNLVNELKLWKNRIGSAPTSPLLYNWRSPPLQLRIKHCHVRPDSTLSRLAHLDLVPESNVRFCWLRLGKERYYTKRLVWLYLDSNRSYSTPPR